MEFDRQFTHKMKIGFDAKRYYHNHTGLGNYSRTLVHGLERYCPEHERVLYDESPLHRSFSLAHQAKQDGCGLLHGLSNEIPFDAVRADIPTLVTIHDTAWRTFPAMYHAIDRQIYDFKYGWSCRHASRVLAISESTKRDVMRFYGVPEERIEVICQPVQDVFYTPVDTATARQTLCEALPNLPHDFCLYVGSINRRKNLLSVVQALGMFGETERPVLVVVGNGREYRKEVEQYIAGKGLGKWVYIIDNLNDGRTLQCLYRLAMTFIYPSFYEGFGLPVVEAALQRCPVITSNVSSLPEAAGDGALLVNPSDTGQLYDSLRRVLEDSSLAERLGLQGEQYARHNFDPQAQALKVYNLYEQMLQQK